MQVRIGNPDVINGIVAEIDNPPTYDVVLMSIMTQIELPKKAINWLSHQ